MFVLFLKECKTICKSIIYLVFICAIVLFYTSQMGEEIKSDIKQYYTNEEYYTGSLLQNPLIKPLENAESYGNKYVEIPEIIMPEAVSSLVIDWKQNNYRKYNFIGMGREINLNEKKQAEIAKIIFDITGIEADELYNRVLEIRVQYVGNDGITHWQDIDFKEIVPIKITYDEYKNKVKQIDKILGGMYGETGLQSMERENVPVTYEEKLTEYNAFISEDKITGAYARYFCDYMGIVAGMLSVFVPAAFLMRDKRAKVNEIIFSRHISSTKFILTRYIALIFMMTLPFLLLSLIPSVQLIEFALKNNMSVDIFAFFKYIFAWILPTIMTTTAVALIITTVADNPIAIVVQFGWSFLNLLTGFSGAVVNGFGQLINYRMNLIIRHNSVSNFQVYKDNLTQLTFNRIFYTVLSMILVVLTIFIYERKRKGEIDVFGGLRKIFRNRKSTG